jgi:hypothetical protein
VIEDDGDSAWLYLTEPGTAKPVLDCWLYNRRAITRKELADWPRDRPLPAPVELASAEALRTSPLPEQVGIRWDQHGESVAVIIDDQVLGFIVAGRKRGYSLYLRSAGPWGEPFDQRLYDRIFVN